MNVTRLHQILAETTTQLRKGPVFEGTPSLVAQAEAGDQPLNGGGVLEVYMMPSVADAPNDLDVTDMEFLAIGVDRTKAQAIKAELVSILDAYPRPERLAGGPSYIEVGAEIGDQGAAFCLFALGKTLGLWSVITPATFGLTGHDARAAAGSGFIMISGYRAQVAP